MHETPVLLLVLMLFLVPVCPQLRGVLAPDTVTITGGSPEATSRAMYIPRGRYEAQRRRWANADGTNRTMPLPGTKSTLTSLYLRPT